MAGTARRLRTLTGGLTNRNYQVTTGSGSRFVARFSSPKSALLSIDRDAEYRNSLIASEIGVGPRVVDYAPDSGVLVVEWIEGRTFADADLDDEAQLARVAQTCARLHAGPAFVSDFDMFDVQRRYRTIVAEYGLRLPEDYDDYEPQVRRVEAALRATAPRPVPCHNDLLAANIMDDGERIWLIDFEYAGNNDPCFELGNIWSEASLAPDRLAQLVDAYYGAPSPVAAARARLFGLMAKYGWTLWACIQASVSDVDFDFWQWGMERYSRAVVEFRSAEFDRLITTVRESI